MGAYLNPGNKSFQIAVNSKIYVDKSEMIQYLNTVLNTQQRFVSVSRPRRFGKTMAADMICAYYDREADSREVFANLKIAEREPIRFQETLINSAIPVQADGHLLYNRCIKPIGDVLHEPIIIQ